MPDRRLFFWIQNVLSTAVKVSLAFAIVYIVWGSTYLGIRIAVHDLPPGLMAGVRFVLAGLILLLAGKAMGKPGPRTRHDWISSLIMAVALVLLGNGLVTWGEQWVESNQAALLITTGAIWTTWFGTFGAKAQSVSGREKVGIAIGLVGAALLLWPKAGLQMDYLAGQLAILGAPIAWSIGTIYSRTYPTQMPPLMFAGLQMLLGGILLLLYGLMAGELPRWQWTFNGIAALLYLTVFGSCLAYGTYVWLIQHTTPARLGTIAYINPVVAVVLGWLVLGETLTGPRLFGAVIILAGVTMISWRAPRKKALSDAKEPGGKAST